MKVSLRDRLLSGIGLLIAAVWLGSTALHMWSDAFEPGSALTRVSNDLSGGALAAMIVYGIVVFALTRTGVVSAENSLTLPQVWPRFSARSLLISLGVWTLVAIALIAVFDIVPALGLSGRAADFLINVVPILLLVPTWIFFIWWFGRTRGRDAGPKDTGNEL